VNIERIGARGLRSRSFARTVAKSEPIATKCAVTGMSFVRIDAICEATFAISGVTAAMLVGTSFKTWVKVEG
jgi:hypothetical protein